MHVFGLLSGHAPDQKLAWACCAVSWVFCVLVLRGTHSMFTVIVDSFGDTLSTEHSSMRRARPAHTRRRKGALDGPRSPDRPTPRVALRAPTPPPLRPNPLPVLSRMARVYTIVLWNLFGLNMVVQNLRLVQPLHTEIIWVTLDFGAKSLFSTLLCQARARALIEGSGAPGRPPRGGVARRSAASHWLLRLICDKTASEKVTVAQRRTRVGARTHYDFLPTPSGQLRKHRHAQGGGAPRSRASKPQRNAD